MRFQLHGGVNGRNTSDPRGNESIGELAGVEQIYIMPYTWTGAPWWTNLQLDNLRAILDTVKRTYNVDENRVALAGFSDGATATFYVAMLDTTRSPAFSRSTVSSWCSATRPRAPTAICFRTTC